MAGKPSLRSEIEEGLVEVVSYYKNFIDALSSIIGRLDANEDIDHRNDKTRSEAMGHLLKALEAYSAKAYEDVDRHVHAAIQRLHCQEIEDLKDDKPRVDARIELVVATEKAIRAQKDVCKLLEKLNCK